MKSLISRFLKDDAGMETVEYAVAAALIVLGAVGAFIALGDNVAAAIQALADKITVPAN